MLLFINFASFLIFSPVIISFSSIFTLWSIIVFPLSSTIQFIILIISLASLNFSSVIFPFSSIFTLCSVISFPLSPTTQFITLFINFYLFLILSITTPFSFIFTPSCYFFSFSSSSFHSPSNSLLFSSSRPSSFHSVLFPLPVPLFLSLFPLRFSPRNKINRGPLVILV